MTCDVSPSPRGVAAVGAPPAADTFWSPLARGVVMLAPGEKTITSLALQVPPRLSGTSQMVTGGPPDTSIFLSFPPAKNARKRPAGDQNGEDAPSVPGSSRAVSASSGRTHSMVRPSGALAANATS